MPSAPLSLRRASAADLDAIMAIERGPGYEALVGRSTREEHEAMFAGSRHAYFVGERDGPQAFAILRDLGGAHGNLYLQRIAVAARGRGDGPAFLSALIDWAFAETATHRFHLDCLDDNFPAHSFYAKHGFRREGVAREAYLAPDGRRRDLLLMALTKPEWLNRAAPAVRR